MSIYLWLRILCWPCQIHSDFTDFYVCEMLFIACLRFAWLTLSRIYTFPISLPEKRPLLFCLYARFKSSLRLSLSKLCITTYFSYIENVHIKPSAIRYYMLNCILTTIRRIFHVNLLKRLFSVYS